MPFPALYMYLSAATHCLFITNAQLPCKWFSRDSALSATTNYRRRENKISPLWERSYFWRIYARRMTTDYGCGIMCRDIRLPEYQGPQTSALRRECILYTSACIQHLDSLWKGETGKRKKKNVNVRYAREKNSKHFQNGLRTRWWCFFYTYLSARALRKALRNPHTFTDLQLVPS